MAFALADCEGKLMGWVLVIIIIVIVGLDVFLGA